MDPEREIRDCRGVGEKRAQQLEKLGIRTVRDLISYFPRDYEDRSVIRPLEEIADGETACVLAVVASVPQLTFARTGLKLVRFTVADDSGAAEVTFFNQPYLKNTFRSGTRYLFYGSFSRMGNRLSVASPAWERADARDGEPQGKIVPIYRLTAGLSGKFLSGLIAEQLESTLPELPELLPPEIAEKYGFPGQSESYRMIHFPKTMAEAGRARTRLVFEELFVLSCALGSMKVRTDAISGYRIPKDAGNAFTASLPFRMTGAQERAVTEILGDMASGRVMNRLVQGDVGSGKTAVAAAAIAAVVRSGYQAAFMAPTELLADQHTATLSRLLAPFGVRVVQLKGGQKISERREALAALESGDAQVAVGTHALLGESVRFRALALAVTDEQHRFGVRQRAALSARAVRPHVLVMSATPIPRTLALIVYGDLDVSVIDELPPGRTPVETYSVGTDYHPRLWRFIEKLAAEGRQVYVVCPRIEEQEEGLPDLCSAETLWQELHDRVFPQLRVALLHGKMKNAEKEAVMADFSSGRIDVLVSTTVIEVGVDVPNATLMVIENAERFGLSQLHQLRGRVGRGSEKSYCVLVHGQTTEEGRERLKLMTKEHDGFKIAEADLRTRGPGDFFGERQHGLPELRIADLASSLDVLRDARAEAEALLKRDPELKKHTALQERIRTLFRETERS